MKTKELIEELMKADPSGELEVNVIGNEVIDFVSKQEAYYDGKLEILIKNENYKPKGYKITGKGYKVKLHTRDLYSCLSSNSNLEIDLSELGDNSRADWERKIEIIRKDIQDIKDSLKPSAEEIEENKAELNYQTRQIEIKNILSETDPQKYPNSIPEKILSSEEKLEFIDEIVSNLRMDFSDAEHQIDYHADTLADNYRDLMEAMDKIHKTMCMSVEEMNKLGW